MPRPGLPARDGWLSIPPRPHHHIDWRALYEERDGYLLFEDLKEQWRRFVEPDYVLMDSCTGHTDAGGI